MVFKSLHELAPQYMCDLFTRASQLTSRYLRNTLTDLRLPKKNSKTGQKCFSFRGAKAWNDLFAEGKLNSSLAIFKKILHSIYYPFYYLGAFFVVSFKIFDIWLLILGLFEMLYLTLDIVSLFLIYVMEGPLKISTAEGPPS